MKKIVTMGFCFGTNTFMMDLAESIREKELEIHLSENIPPAEVCSFDTKEVEELKIILREHDNNFFYPTDKVGKGGRARKRSNFKKMK